jgi:hypothetical protein
MRSTPATRRTNHTLAVTQTAKPEGVAASWGTMATAALPGHLPKVDKLTVEALTQGQVSGVQALTVVAHVDMGMLSSGLAHLPGGQLLAISDNTGVCEVRADASPRKLHRLKDGEGITTDPSGKFVYVVEEAKGRVTKLEVEEDQDGRIKLKDTDEHRRLPQLKGSKNSGWEGLSFLPAAMAGDGRDHLVCVHEGSPRRIGIYALPDIDSGHTLKLPSNAKDLLPDLADVAVDPRTGHIFVVSDQERMLVELVLVKKNKSANQGMIEQAELVMVSSTQLPLGPNQKPEALSFDERGRLWVGLDNEDDNKNGGKALVIELKR